MVFPLLFEMSNLAFVRKAGPATSASDAAKTGLSHQCYFFIQSLEFSLPFLDLLIHAK